MDLFSSLVTLLEGYIYALEITYDGSGFRWLYGLNTKDDLLKAIQKWYSDIAELQERHNVCVVIRDNAGENKSREVIEFFESNGIKSFFSTPYEQWQNGQGKSSINSLIPLERSVMVESGPGGQFWFSTAWLRKMFEM
jgi:hypothetical protein